MKQDLKRELEVFFGYPPHDEPSNYSRRDNYYAIDIKRRYGKSIEELAKIAGVPLPKDWSHETRPDST